MHRFLWPCGLNFLHLIEITGVKYIFCENAPFLAPLLVLWEPKHKYNLQGVILNPVIPNVLKSDNPIKSYSSLHISYWPVGALSATTSFVGVQVASRWNYEAQ